MLLWGASENNTEEKLAKLWLTEQLIKYYADEINTFWVCNKSWTAWTNVQRMQSPKMTSVNVEWSNQLSNERREIKYQSVHHSELFQS